MTDGNYDNIEACAQMALRMKGELLGHLKNNAISIIGMDYRISETEYGYKHEVYVPNSGPAEHLCWQEWNPESDDGQSQRLRTKLRLGVEWFNNTVTVIDWSNSRMMRYTEHVSNHDSPDAALRWATLIAVSNMAN